MYLNTQLYTKQYELVVQYVISWGYLSKNAEI